MNTLTLVPQGGLCNRLRAMLSVLSLVDTGRLDADIHVGWGISSECGAHYDQLFLPLTLPRLTVHTRRWYDRPITRSNLHWPAIVRCFRYDRQFINLPPSLDDFDALVANGSFAVYVSTGIAFCDYPSSYIQRLLPLPHLQQRIDALSASFDSHTIGVHIRRTDHSTAIAESPDALFEQAIAEAIAADPDARFYVSTDDEALKQTLADRFPARIMSQECHGTRANLSGMEEAVIDLWTLARTSRIIGSYWSSFSDTAAEIGGIPLNIIRK